MNSTAGKRRKCGYLSLLFFLSMALLTVTGCSDSSGSNPLTTASYSMSDFFPLSSGWETDRWTLFVDESEHEIGGVSTKAMVDTSKAEAYFWSNDAEGLRVHGFWSPETGSVSLTPPVKLAEAMAEVGDRLETTFSIDGDSFAASAELMAVESVTTPAGTFDNCLRFMLHVYPTGSAPEDFGYETVWFAENVGFVKAQTDGDAHMPLFSRKGETRQLLSYHLTPSFLFSSERAVRETFKQWLGYWNDQSIAALTGMTHDGFYERCKDKDEALDDWNDFFNGSEDYNMFATIEDVDVVGDDAYVLREYLETYTDQATGEPVRSWGRSTVRLNNQSGEWQIYGDQMDVYRSFASVYPRVTPTSTTFAAPVEVTDCATGDWPETDDQIASVTVTGPAASGMVDLPIPWDPAGGWYGFWLLPPNDDISQAADGFYTFEVIDVDGNLTVYTDYLALAAPLDIPVLVSPADAETNVSTNVTFQWDPVAGANSYMLRVYEVESGTRVVNITTDETTYDATLDPGTDYEWQLRARYYDPNDGAEYDNESRSSYRSFTTAP